MALFRITYTDPHTQERVTVEEEFKDSPACGVIPGWNEVAHGPISARCWAEDAAYSYADKNCDYEIVEIRQRSC